MQRDLRKEAICQAFYHERIDLLKRRGGADTAALVEGIEAFFMDKVSYVFDTREDEVYNTTLQEHLAFQLLKVTEKLYDSLNMR